MAAWIEARLEGQIVAVALQGEGRALLNERAVVALYSLGGQVDPRGQAGWSQALIGVKGAAPGTAMESAGAGPADGWLRVAPDRRTLSIAVDRVEWEQPGP